MVDLSISSPPRLREFYMADEVASWMRKVIDLDIVVRAQMEKLNRASQDFTAGAAEVMITEFQDVRKRLGKWSMRSRHEAHRRLEDVSRNEELGTTGLLEALAYENQTRIEEWVSLSHP